MKVNGEGFHGTQGDAGSMTLNVGPPKVGGGVRAPEGLWADLRGDKMINPAPGFWPIFGPLGPTAGPGNGPGSKIGAGCTKNQPRRPILSPIRRHFVFLGPTAQKYKYK